MQDNNLESSYAVVQIVLTILMEMKGNIGRSALAVSLIATVIYVYYKKKNPH